MFCCCFCRYAERTDATATVVVPVGRQRADGAGGRRERASAVRGAASGRHAPAALPPRLVQAGALPAAALPLPAAQPPSLPLWRVPTHAAAASISTLSTAQGILIMLVFYFIS